MNNNNLVFSGDCLLVITSNCKPVDPKSFELAWERFLKRNNIPLKKFHSLRNSYATSLFRKRANLLQVKELLGHSSSNTIEKYYIHVFPEDKTETVNLLSDLVLNQVGK